MDGLLLDPERTCDLEAFLASSSDGVMELREK